MNDNKIGTYKFVAEPFHVDFTGKLTMGVLGNHLLNCAGFHASERGFGIAELNENHYTWVLSRLAIELEDMPRQYEDFSINTWIENVYRLFTDRNFELQDKKFVYRVIVDSRRNDFIFHKYSQRQCFYEPAIIIHLVN